MCSGPDGVGVCPACNRVDGLQVRDETGTLQLLDYDSLAAVSLQPAIPMDRRCEHVRLGAIAAAVGEHEILRNVAWITRPRDEVVDITLAGAFAAIETEALLRLGKDRTDLCQRLPRLLEHEGFKIAGFADERPIACVLAHVSDPAILGKADDKTLEAAECKGHASEHCNLPATRSNLVNEPDALSADILQIAQRLIPHGLGDCPNHPGP
jgi:hypothetical protein